MQHTKSTQKQGTAWLRHPNGLKQHEGTQACGMHCTAATSLYIHPLGVQTFRGTSEL